MDKIKIFESEDAIEECQKYDKCSECPFASFPANHKYKPICRLLDVNKETYEEDDEGMDWFL